MLSGKAITEACDAVLGGVVTAALADGLYYRADVFTPHGLLAVLTGGLMLAVPVLAGRWLWGCWRGLSPLWRQAVLGVGLALALIPLATFWGLLIFWLLLVPAFPAAGLALARAVVETWPPGDE